MCTGLDIVLHNTVDLQGQPEPTARLVYAYRADIVFLELSTTTLPAALELLTQLQLSRYKPVIVGFANALAEDQRAALEAGIWQVLTPPFDEQDFLQTVRLAFAQPRNESSVHGFIPAKGGAGATLTALNTATCLAQVLKRKVLLIEADFYSGILPLLLKFSPPGSVMDALALSERLDESSWGGMIAKRHGIDVLAAWGPRTAGQDSSLKFDRLLAFAKQRYDVVLVDLPVVVDRVTEAVGYQAERVYVVSTPERICMDVARRRLRQLETCGTRPNTLGVILNRVLGHPAEVDIQEHERAIGGKIYGVLPNDYLRLQAAIAAEGPVDPKSLLGKAYLALAGSITGVDIPLPSPSDRSASLRNLFCWLTRTDPEKGASVSGSVSEQNVPAA